MVGLIEIGEEAYETSKAWRKPWERERTRKNNDNRDPEGIIKKEILCLINRKKQG